ncbi:MAG: hypothetical protein LBV20_02450 [Treponema sp.]|jgi:hypothetical protein|nr:hypothetical protein [Treponema sp.]
MSGEKTLSAERIAEIKSFKNIDFSDCPIMTEEELDKLRPRHPEHFKPVKKTTRDTGLQYMQEGSAKVPAR